MITKSVSRRWVLVGTLGSLVTIGGMQATSTPTVAGRRRKRGRGRNVTVHTGAQNTYTYDETNTSVVAGPDGSPGPDEVVNN